MKDNISFAVFFVMLLGITSNISMAAEPTCDSLLATHSSQLSSLYDPGAEYEQIPDNVIQSLNLAEQGFEQCHNGQEELGITSLRQAISLLGSQ